MIKNLILNKQKYSKSSMMNPINQILKINNQQRFINIENG